MGGDKGADEVQVEDKFHAAFIQVEKALGVCLQVTGLKVLFVGGGPGIVASCPVDQHVAGPQVGHNLVCHGIAHVLVQHIALVGPGHAALVVDLPGKLLGGLLVQVQQGHLGPRPGQHLGKGGAQHAARASDNRYLSS